MNAWHTLRRNAPGPLICPVTQGGEIQLRRMSGRAICDALGRRAHHAGVGTFSPHDCRRTMIGDLLDAGADLSAALPLTSAANASARETPLKIDPKPS